MSERYKHIKFNHGDKIFLQNTDNICTLCYNIIVKRNTIHESEVSIWLEGEEIENEFS